MIHVINPNPAEPWLAENFIDLLMLMSREGIEMTGVRLKSSSFLMLAWACQIDDPSEMARVVSRQMVLGRSVDWASADPRVKTHSPATVRVGRAFVVRGVRHGQTITVVEDKENA